MQFITEFDINAHRELSELHSMYPHYFNIDMCQEIINIGTDVSTLPDFIVGSDRISNFDLIVISSVLEVAYRKRHKLTFDTDQRLYDPMIMLDDLQHEVQNIPFIYPEAFPPDIWNAMHHYSMKHMRSYSKEMMLEALMHGSSPVEEFVTAFKYCYVESYVSVRGEFKPPSIIWDEFRAHVLKVGPIPNQSLFVSKDPTVTVHYSEGYKPPSDFGHLNEQGQWIPN